MKNKFISIMFLIIIFSFSIASLIEEDKIISNSERRRLVNISKLKENFRENLDDYLTDQFFLREEFLSLNNTFNRFILNNYGYNDVYFKSGYIYENIYPLDENSLNNFITSLNNINNKYLKHSNVFYSIIPDKSYFLDNNKYLKIDYSHLFAKLQNNIEIPYINIENLLDINDYYQSDIHIKQPSYFKIIPQLSENYKFKIKDVKYIENDYSEFKGSSFYKIPFKNPEKLTYLTNEYTNNATVSHLEYKDKEIYKTEELKGIDPYNVFLSGPSSLIEIINNTTLESKELIIFRDSFGSSLAPLLLPYYHKITLIDLRYINLNLLSNYVDFHNKDVLFLYSTLIINNSYILKTN